MNNQQLGPALVKLDTADLSRSSESDRQTWQILDRDRRRVRWWTIVTILAWIPATLLALGILIGLALLFPMDAKLHQIQAERRAKQGAPAQPPVDALDESADIIDWEGRPINVRQLERDLEIAFKEVSVLTALAILALSFAMLFSIVLLFASRRATLRQINANLLAISDQLKHLEGRGAAAAQSGGI
jgi:hypothetical protein